jgi:hypothetical protein
MKIMFTNAFHQTSAMAISKGFRVSAQSIRRIKRVLRGITGCACPPWTSTCTVGGIKARLEQEYDGSYTIEKNTE